MRPVLKSFLAGLTFLAACNKQVDEAIETPVAPPETPASQVTVIDTLAWNVDATVIDYLGSSSIIDPVFGIRPKKEDAALIPAFNNFGGDLSPRGNLNIQVSPLPETANADQVSTSGDYTTYRYIDNAQMATYVSNGQGGPAFKGTKNGDSVHVNVLRIQAQQFAIRTPNVMTNAYDRAQSGLYGHGMVAIASQGIMLKPVLKAE